jgi:hypothetical protein
MFQQSFRCLFPRADGFQLQGLRAILEENAGQVASVDFPGEEQDAIRPRISPSF